ncbi:MAG: SDR family oxidoreductase [Actinomycetota bacterium]|nr:SDR family oxidoreductase [Actinomycetota bacterium]
MAIPRVRRAVEAVGGRPNELAVSLRAHLTEGPAGIDTLAGRVAVVTGGANGLGRAVARALALQGADIVLADVESARSERVLSELASYGTGARLMSLTTDVRSDRQVRALAIDALKTFGRVDIVVNAAGVLLRGRLDRIHTRDWEWMLEANLLGAVRTANAFLPALMDAGRGHIVNTVPMGALRPFNPDTVAYNAGFAAVAAFTQGLAAHLDGTEVWASLLCPGPLGPRLGQATRSRGLGRSLHPVEHSAAAIRAAEQLAGRLVDGIHNPRFLIVADDEDERILRLERPDLNLIPGMAGAVPPG